MRMIHASSENGEYEAVVFTEENWDAIEFFEGTPATTIDADVTIPDFPGFIPSTENPYSKDQL